MAKKMAKEKISFIYRVKHWFIHHPWLYGMGCCQHLGSNGLGNTGPHGFSELLYAFSSGTGNNGSAFAGLTGNKDFRLPWRHLFQKDLKQEQEHYLPSAAVLYLEHSRGRNRDLEIHSSGWDGRFLFRWKEEQRSLLFLRLLP
jgi:hypothetical protein